MCLLLIALKHHSEYPFIIAANRDEYHARPASTADFWDDKQNILAGKDLQAGGTWLGMTKQGRFAAVTNYHEQNTKQIPIKSRGAIVIDYLESDTTAYEYAHSVLKRGNDYQGFTLVCGTVKDLYFCSNRSETVEQIKPGIHALSNYLFNDKSYKVKKSKESLDKLISERASINHEDLFCLLQDRTLELQTDIAEKKEEQSPVFIQGKNFGTRCSTVISTDKKGNVSFSERTFKPDGTPVKTVQYVFSC